VSEAPFQKTEAGRGTDCDSGQPRSKFEGLENGTRASGPDASGRDPEAAESLGCALKDTILEFARRNGCIAGICPAAEPAAARGVLERRNALTPFVSRDLKKRLDPAAHLPGAKSVIVLGRFYGGDSAPYDGTGGAESAPSAAAPDGNAAGGGYHAALRSLPGELRSLPGEPYDKRPAFCAGDGVKTGLMTAMAAGGDYHAALRSLPVELRSLPGETNGEDPAFCAGKGVKTGLMTAMAAGGDYHAALRSLLGELARVLGEKAEFRHIIKVDGAGLLEREYAKTAGLGFQGKNCCVICPGKGSFFNIGLMLVDIEIPPTRCDSADVFEAGDAAAAAYASASADTPEAGDAPTPVYTSALTDVFEVGGAVAPVYSSASADAAGTGDAPAPVYTPASANAAVAGDAHATANWSAAEERRERPFPGAGKRSLTRGPGRRSCGDCDLCVKACPAGAIAPGGYEIAASKCVSWLTQKDGELTAREREVMGPWVYGCDICQLVCPHNASAGVEPVRLDLEQLLEMDDGEFDAVFVGTCAAWRGRGILRRNAENALININSGIYMY